MLLLACLRDCKVGDSLPSVRLLLEVGADPNAKLRGGPSTLHIVAQFVGKGETKSPLAELLLEYGAHIDHANVIGQQTPLDVWKERNNAGEADDDGGVLSPPAWLNPVLPLKCYCARVIKRSYPSLEEDQLPFKGLRDFVAEH